MTTAYDASPAAGWGSDPALESVVAALRAAYDRTVNAIMTSRYGPGWATRGDLPEDAYTTEAVFTQWLSDLLDHIDGAAAGAGRVAAS